MAICAELRNFARMNNKIKFLLLYILAAFPLLASAQYTDELCEDSCDHIHGIDISHYQGSVFWEAIGNNSKMAYVYMKATEGGDRIDHMYEENIHLAHRYGLKVGSYHFFRPKTPLRTQLRNFMMQCRPGDQDLIPMIDVESTASSLQRNSATR